MTALKEMRCAYAIALVVWAMLIWNEYSHHGWARPEAGHLVMKLGAVVVILVLWALAERDVRRHGPVTYRSDVERAQEETR